MSIRRGLVLLLVFIVLCARADIARRYFKEPDCKGDLVDSTYFVENECTSKSFYSEYLGLAPNTTWIVYSYWDTVKDCSIEADRVRRYSFQQCVNMDQTSYYYEWPVENSANGFHYLVSVVVLALFTL
eukprot:TRINITY_DN10833_c0_g1_i1.p1 TRINITY_DN10833_c0_g1~~TRINITY_DN10833_c0_g1_i1.p1  ORF type:complete len:141 (+),score=27.15 TRINITY_DN10833_c0_g1_i1:40-423(+)